MVAKVWKGWNDNPRIVPCRISLYVVLGCWFVISPLGSVIYIIFQVEF